MPQVSDRVKDLVSKMTTEEKIAQIVSFWPDQGGNIVAPMADEMAPSGTRSLKEITEHGLGQYTRIYGTRPVDPIKRAQWLWNEQRRLKRETRLGIPALVHEECLTGFAAWQAASFPTPLAWGATFDPELINEMGQLIGQSMKQLGVHLGLAPVLDVIRDPRWGRTEEAISEDPYVVGTIATNYVKGMQDAGIHATLKHFVGYSGSKAGRNHAPVMAGQREIQDVFLLPFEMAVLDGNVRSVMNSYTDVDGIPCAANEWLLTDVLRDKWGFDGTVVADYFAVAFLQKMHAVAATKADAAGQALHAGLDVELPGMDAFPELVAAVRNGEFDERYIDRAVMRHLAQKEALGLLEPDAFENRPPSEIDLDSPAHRAVAKKIAEESIVLLSNNGILPLRPSAIERDEIKEAAGTTKIALIGPNADSTAALQGCYSFENHILAHFPDTERGFEFPTIKEALENYPSVEPGAPAPTVETTAAKAFSINYAKGCEAEGYDTSGFAEAVQVAENSDVAVVVVGDRAGLFGRGTVGEGNDAETLELPGVQRQLIESVLATGKPVIVILTVGRPYVIDWMLDGVELASGRTVPAKPDAVLFAAFPGEEGAPALVEVLTGAVNPSGRLPISLPRSTGAQPYSYLHPILGGPSAVTSTDTTPVRPFGFGLSYTEFAYSDLQADATAATDGTFTASVTVTNTGKVAGSDIVQLYGRDVVASITRPVAQLLGYQRVNLQPGESRRVTFTVPTTRFAFSDRTMARVVEPGDVQVWVASHSAVPESADATAATGGVITSKKEHTRVEIPGSTTPRATINLTGPTHKITNQDQRWVTAKVA